MSQKKSPVVLFEREQPYYSNCIRIEDGFLKASSYISEGERFELFNIHLDDKDHFHSEQHYSTHAPVFLQFIRRAIRLEWSIEFMVKDGACGFRDGKFIPLSKVAFANIESIDLNDDSFQLTFRPQTHAKDKPKQFIRYSDVLGFILRPRTIIGSDKRHIAVGEIVMHRYISGGHDYFVDFKVLDTRLLEGIADFTQDYSCNRGYVDIHSVFKINERRFVVGSEKELALAVALTRIWNFEEARRYPDYSDVMRDNSDFLGFNKETGSAVMSIDDSGRISISTISREVAKLREAKAEHAKLIRALKKTTKEKKVDK